MTNEARVPTRMGDGTFTQLTRSEIRADLIAGSEVAAKRGQGAAAHRRRDRPPARDLRVAAALHRRRRGRGDRPQLRRHRHEDARHAHPGPAVLRAVDGRRPAGALRRRLLAQGGAHDPRLRGPVHARRPAVHHRAAAVRRHAQPGPLLQARRPVRELERAAAAGQDPRGARRRRRGGRDGRRRHGQAGRLAVGGRRGRDRLGHDRRLRRPRVPRRAARHEDHPREVPGHGRAARAWPASSCSACTASSSGTACGWPACGRASSSCSRRRPAPPCSAPSSTSTPASRSPGTWPAPSR